MSLEEIKKDAIVFFEEAINKWNQLITCINRLNDSIYELPKETNEANKILAWFQENYLRYKKISNFEVVENLANGKTITKDPVFNVVFGGANVQHIIENSRSFVRDLNIGEAHLRGHLSNVKDLIDLPQRKEEQLPIIRVRRLLSRCNLVIEQLRRRRKNKTPYLFEDEYDIQDLIHALLKIDFDDVRKEEWTPSYAGGSSRIDFVLKEENILIEAKITSEIIREKELGKQLIDDIAHYKSYPEASILVCFIFDPKHWIENPDGLKHDLEKQSTKDLNIEVIICL